MFIRVKRSGTRQAPREYLQLVRSVRQGGQVRQQVLATLGRLEALRESGQIDALLRSLSRWTERMKLFDPLQKGVLSAAAARSWGPALLLERLWQEQGLPGILERLAEGRRFGFDVERACFALALQRLCEPGSDLQGSQWLSTVEAPALAGLELQHLYRTVGWLSEVRSELEQALFEKDRDLFTQNLDLVFVDTTSVYIYRDEPTPWRRRGYSRERRPELAQVILGVAVDDHSWPVGWESFPGNTADPVAMKQLVERLKARLPIQRITVVADRAMISKGMITLLESGQTPFDWILGCRLRTQERAIQEALASEGAYEPVAENLQVRERSVQGRRYVICRNPIEAAQDASDRAALLEKLRATLSRQGAKSMIGNRGFARYLKTQRGSIELNEDAIEREARLDGIFVLATNTELPPAQVAQSYKSLWRVERTFREQKSTLQIRPIFHHRDDTTLGHIAASFLALRLEVHLQRRLDEQGIQAPWAELMRDLRKVQAIDLELCGQRYRVRSPLQGWAGKAFTAVGVRPPATLTPLEPAPEL